MKTCSTYALSTLSPALIRAACRALALAVLAIAVTTRPAMAADTGTIGGPGGGSYRLMCPGNRFLVGVTGRSGDWMDQIAPVCVAVTAGRWTGPPSTGRATGGSGGGEFTAMCEPDSVVVGFSGYSGEYVFNLALYCRKGERIRMASPGMVGGALDIGSTAGFYCLTDHAANGIIGRSGIYVDGFGLACAGYIGAAPVPAPSAPAPAKPKAGDRASGTLQNGGVTALLPRWSSRTFAPPNGGLVAFTIMPDGNPACASYNGTQCLWGVALAQIDLAKLKPLVCGEMHRRVWGATGFEDPKHWCSLARPGAR